MTTITLTQRSGLIDFEDTTAPLDLSGGAAAPWDYSSDTSGAACDGSLGLKAGSGINGVNRKSVVSFTAPVGATSMTFFRSHSSIGGPYDYRIDVDGVEVRNYVGTGVVCASDCIFVSGGAVVQFECRSATQGEECTLDHVRFWGVSGARKLAGGKDNGKPTLLSMAIASAPSPPPFIHGPDATKPANDDAKQKLNDKSANKKDSPPLRGQPKVKPDANHEPPLRERARLLREIKRILILFNGSLLFALYFRKWMETHHPPPRRRNNDNY